MLKTDGCLDTRQWEPAAFIAKSTAFLHLYVCLGEGRGLSENPDMVSGGSYYSNDFTDALQGEMSNAWFNCWRRPPAEASSPPRCPSRTPPLRTPWQELWNSNRKQMFTYVEGLTRHRF